MASSQTARSDESDSNGENMLTKTGERIRFVKLIRDPRWRYGIAYLLCIPLFAFIYWLIPHGFYQSSMKTESAHTEEGAQVLGKFCRSLALQLPVATEPQNEGKDAMQLTQALGSWSFTPGPDLRCERLRIIDDDRIAFTATVTLHKKPRCPDVLVGDYCFEILDVPFRVSIEPIEARGMVESRIFIPPGTQRRREFDEYAHPIEVMAGKVPLLFRDDRLVNDLTRIMFRNKSIDMEFALILNATFEDEITEFLQASNGFTSDAGGNIWRMLYFSAVTIATLGYGDIVPVTSTTRLLAGVEVIAGVVLAGLFINATARRRNDRGLDI